MKLLSNILFCLRRLFDLYKAEPFRPFLATLSNYFFFFNSDRAIVTTIGLRYYSFLFILLEKLPADLSTDELWSIVTGMGMMIRLQEISIRLKIQGLEVLRMIISNTDFSGRSSQHICID